MKNFKKTDWYLVAKLLCVTVLALNILYFSGYLLIDMPFYKLFNMMTGSTVLLASAAITLELWFFLAKKLR